MVLVGGEVEEVADATVAEEVEVADLLFWSALDETARVEIEHALHAA